MGAIARADHPSARFHGIEKHVQVASRIAIGVPVRLALLGMQAVRPSVRLIYDDFSG
ncbi:hypothetical protein D3C73_1651870 [compost metagenome]